VAVGGRKIESDEGQGAPRQGRHPALADLVSGVAHEIRNPLNGISLASQVLQKLLSRQGVDLTEFREYFRVIHFELGRIRKVVDNFVKFARVPDLRPEPILLDALLEPLLESLRPELRERGIELEGRIDPGLRVRADQELLADAFGNLLRNSAQSIEGRGTITVVARLDGDRVRVVQTDDGPGLPEGDAERIFDPYFTTRPGRQGLGLTLARSIIESHGGSIRAASLPEKGAEFVVELPGQMDGEGAEHE